MNRLSARRDSCRCVAAIVLSMCGATALTARAANWPQWRGPFFNGSTTETGLPVRWTTSENIAWRARMPGRSSSTPVVWGNLVFTTAADARTKDLLALALDARNGTVLWSKKAGTDRPTMGNRHNMSSPSPVTTEVTFPLLVFIAVAVQFV